MNMLYKSHKLFFLSATFFVAYYVCESVSWLLFPREIATEAIKIHEMLVDAYGSILINISMAVLWVLPIAGMVLFVLGLFVRKE